MIWLRYNHLRYHNLRYQVSAGAEIIKTYMSVFTDIGQNQVPKTWHKKVLPGTDAHTVVPPSKCGFYINPTF